MQLVSTLALLLADLAATASAAAMGSRQLSSLVARDYIPAVCFAECNNIQVVINADGVDCTPGSAYLGYYDGCVTCCSANGGDIGNAYPEC